MPALDHARRWTRAEVLALPDDGNRYELVDGELLVSPGPRPLHQRAINHLSHALTTYVRAHGLGAVYCSPADLDLGSGQLVQPDIFVTSRRGFTEWTEVGMPSLVIEVLSPSSVVADRLTKRVRYQRSGVPLYWIVDLDARRVETWTPLADRPAVVADTLTWQPDPAAPALELDLPTYFAETSETAG
jgi:Uma2 family endonuclease